MKTRRSPKAKKPAPSPPPAGPPAYVDPGWISRKEDMLAPWDGASPTWLEREAIHLLRRLEYHDEHPTPPPEAARRLLHDSQLILKGVLDICADLRASRGSR